MKTTPPDQSKSTFDATHFLVGILAGGNLALVLFSQQPWGGFFALGYGLIMAYAVFFLIKKPLWLRAFVTFLVVISLSFGPNVDSMAKGLSWALCGLLFGFIVMKLLRGLPDENGSIMKNPIASTVCAALGGLITFILIHIIPTWMAVIAGWVIAAALFPNIRKNKPA